MREPSLRPALTVKDKVGRTRYVVFRLEGASAGRGAVAGILPEGARLTRFDGTHGIVRTTHDRRDEVVAALNATARLGGRDVAVRTLATSGTIRAAARRLPPSSPAATRGRRSPPEEHSLK